MSGATSNNEPRESASRRHSSHNPTHSPIHTRASEHMTWYYTEQGLCMALSNAIQARGRSSPQSSSLSEAASRRRLATVEATLQPDSTAKLLAPPHCKPAPDHTGYRSALVTSAARLRRSRADFSYLAISASTNSRARDSSSSSNDTMSSLEAAAKSPGPSRGETLGGLGSARLDCGWWKTLGSSGLGAWDGVLEPPECIDRRGLDSAFVWATASARTAPWHAVT